MHDTRSVVIVGANIAGMTAARALAGRISVKVFEPTAALEWLPNIHELISGLKRPHNLRVERGPLLARAGHDWHRQGEYGDKGSHCGPLGAEQCFDQRFGGNGHPQIERAGDQHDQPDCLEEGPGQCAWIGLQARIGREGDFVQWRHEFCCKYSREE